MIHIPSFLSEIRVHLTIIQVLSVLLENAHISKADHFLLRNKSDLENSRFSITVSTVHACIDYLKCSKLILVLFFTFVLFLYVFLNSQLGT